MPLNSVSIDSLAPALVRHMPVAVVIFDAKARVICHNPLFVEMFGFSVPLGNECFFGELIEPGALNGFLDEMSSLVKKQQDSLEMTCRYRGADGKESHWMHIRVVPLPEGCGNPELVCLYYAVIDDVSSNIDEHQRLQREKELAIQATRSKSTFLATMSHEIRTPIHTVTGMAELLLETNLDNEQLEYIRQIRFSAEVLLGLINDVLDLSKIEAGRLSLEIINFDLEKVVEDSVDMQGLTAFSRGLEILLDCPHEMPRMVQGDPVRLRQIITNLLSNAIKFTRKGEVMVRLRVLDQQGSRYRIRFEVQDTGIGIPEAKQALLFQAFSQLDSSMTRRFGGTGLGLSICRSLVNLMGGEIGASSVEGHGSLFWFEIAFEAANLEHAPPRKPPRISPDLKILVVDDVARSRQVIRSILEPCCPRVFEAENGPMALAMLRSTSQTAPFDLVLVDLEMPLMDGWQFASEVNADRSINSTRLFLMVPPGKMGGDTKMKLLNWFDDYVSKPVKRAEILAVLERNMENSLDLEAVDVPIDTAPMIVHPKPETPANAGRPAGNGPARWARKLKIMVAEDHFVNQKLFETILERLGHLVVLASDGREALRLGLSEQPDLVFMDMQMPEMNGYEATQALRQAGFRAPIIAVTANALKGDQEKCLQGGMNDYLSKPFQKADVDLMIRRWCPGDGPPERAKPGARIEENEAPEEFTGNAVHDPGVFDFAKALEVFMNDRETLLSVLRGFVERTEGQLDAMDAAVSGQDFPTASRLAHTIKGSSWNLGIRRLGDTAQSMESACQGLDAVTARDIMPAFRQAWQEFMKAVEHYLEQ